MGQRNTPVPGQQIEEEKVCSGCRYSFPVSPFCSWKLEAYSVWMSILSGGFKFALFVIACLVIALIRMKPAGDEG